MAARTLTDSYWPRAEKAMDHLDREGLISRDSSFMDDKGNPVVGFEMTEFGMELFGAALGVEMIAFGTFCELPSERLRLEQPIEPMVTRPLATFAEEWNSGRDFDTAWARTAQRPISEDLAVLEGD